MPATLLEPIRSFIQENRKRDKRLQNAFKEIPSESGVSLVCVKAEQLAEQLTLVCALCVERWRVSSFVSHALPQRMIAPAV